jgi:hypothetical protein
VSPFKMWTKSVRAAKLFALVLAAPALGSLPGCTDLTENPASSITPENFYRNTDEVMGGLASVYSQLRNAFPGYAGAYWNISEVSSDEMIVPTRGADWLDNGRWIELDRQLWGPGTPSGLEDLNGTWTQAFTGVTRANVLLAALENVVVADEAVITAEIRTLRAFYYYMLMDFFGGVPIVTTTEIMPRAKNTRREVFDFIETELNEARAALPDRWAAAMHGRMTKGAADAILANMYLNAGVFARDNVSATAYNSCTTVQIGGQNACQAAIAAADRILNSGVYSLASDWRANFRHDNQLSPENILVVKFRAEPDLGLRFVQASTHYNQFNPSPWNGFSILADAYNQFDADDQRRQALLAGPQVCLDASPCGTVPPGQPVRDRQGNPLVFTVTINNPQQATEGEGVRFLKWPPDPGHVQQDNGNDFAYFRLGEIYLIKSEAQLELGNAAGATLLVNTLRARVFTPPEPIPVADRDAILRERLFELVAEGKRRQDLIRHGRFTQPWTHKEQREAHRILMPIPQTQLDANPLLVQNTGY